jgi:2-aminoadipate transaminase
MDEEGLDPETLQAELRRNSDPPSFLYTIPTFQNPSGRTLSRDRRQRVVDIASEHRLPILEDDPYGLVRYEGEPPPTLHELEGGELVTYTSSFSKIVAPGLRTGYFVLPRSDDGAFEERAVSTYISPPFHAQATIAEFIASGRFEPNLVRVCTSLRERRDAMLHALERNFPNSASWNRPEGGYFLWLELGEGTDASDLARRAEAEGVTIVRGEDFFPAAGTRAPVPGSSQAAGSRLGASSARLAFSYEPPERIAEGIAALSALLG